MVARKAHNLYVRFDSGIRNKLIYIQMKTLVLSLFLATFLFFGCKPCEPIVIDNTTIQWRDSIVLRTVRDTVTVYPKQENKTVAVDSSFLKTDLAFSLAKIQPDGKLFHSIENYGMIPAKIIENTKIINKGKNTHTTKTITLERKVYKNKWGLLDWIGLAVIILSVIFVVLKLTPLKRFL